MGRETKAAFGPCAAGMGRMSDANDISALAYRKLTERKKGGGVIDSNLHQSVQRSDAQTRRRSYAVIERHAPVPNVRDQ